MSYLSNLSLLESLLQSGHYREIRRLNYPHEGGELPKEFSLFDNLQHLSLHIQPSGRKNTSFPDVFFSLQKLESLTIEGLEMEALPLNFGDLQELQSLHFIGCSFDDFSALSRLPKLVDITFTSCAKVPQNWEGLQHLERLQFRNSSLESLPELLYDLKNLRELVATIRTKTLDPRLSRLRNLQTLGLNSGQLESLPDDIFKGWGKLERLYLNSNQLLALPASVSQLRTLKEIGITNNALSALPTTWASKNLRELSIYGNKISHLPDWVADLPKLENLYAAENQLSALPAGLEQLPALRRLSLDKNPLPLSQALKMLASDSLRAFSADALHANFARKNGRFLELFQSLPYEKAHRLDLYTLLSAETTEAAQAPMSAILQASRSNDPLLNEAAQAQLASRYAQSPKPLHRGASLQVRGDVPFKKTDIKERLQALGIAYSPTLKADTTHVVVGKKNKDTSEREGLIWLSAADLDQFFKREEAQYIAQADTKAEEGKHTIAQLSALLLSPDSPTVQVGVEMLKGGGVPKELITALFAVFKNPKLDSKMRADVKKMLLLNGSPQLIKNLALKGKLFSPHASPSTVHRVLLEFIAGTELEGLKIAYYLQKFGINTETSIAHLLPAAERLPYLRQLLQKKDYTITYSEQYPIWLQHAKEWAQLAPEVLQISGTYYPKPIPPQVFACTNTQILHLSGCTLDKLPEDLLKLQKLTTLYLHNNLLSRLPDFLLKDMPNLKTIHAYNNPFSQKGSNDTSWQAYFDAYNGDLSNGILIRKSP